MATLSSRATALYARLHRLREENPGLLCWIHACQYYRHRAELGRWFGRSHLSHRLFHALEHCPCANALHPDD